MISKMCLFLAGLFFLLSNPTYADDMVVVITAENIEHLRSVMQIDFEDVPETFNTGWFTMTTTGDRYAVRDVENTIHIWNIEGEREDSFAITDEGNLVVAMTFNSDGTLLVAMDSSGSVVFRDLQERVSIVMPLLEPDQFVQQMWVDAETLWIEVVSIEGMTSILGYTYVVSGDGITLSDEVLQLDYAPADDTDAVVRIGRIPPPYVVTSSQDGMVKRWDLQTGTSTEEAYVDDGPAVFGQINASASHLVWRDQMSEMLYLLDFESGENQAVAPLDGRYVQYFFLTLEADVIIAAHIEDQPDIIAWYVTTGERIELGEHRDCNRVPDMIQLSSDGTTLVIGCDTGLDIWQIID